MVFQDEAHAAQLDAAMIALAGPERFVRQARRDVYQRKVGITLGPEWLDASGLDNGGVGSFRRQHLAQVHWQPSARAAALVDQLISPPEFTPAVHRLYLESRALELVAEAFSHLESGTCPPECITARGHARLLALRDWLDSGEADALSLQDIASHAALNAHTLQAQFRAAFGATIFEYLRKRRLDRARIALERDGVSINEAAWQAGYTSASNFATAFRKRFGMSPKQVQHRGI